MGQSHRKVRRFRFAICPFLPFFADTDPSAPVQMITTHSRYPYARSLIVQTKRAKKMGREALADCICRRFSILASAGVTDGPDELIGLLTDQI